MGICRKWERMLWINTKQEAKRMPHTLILFHYNMLRFVERKVTEKEGHQDFCVCSVVRFLVTMIHSKAPIDTPPYMNPCFVTNLFCRTNEGRIGIYAASTTTRQFDNEHEKRIRERAGEFREWNLKLVRFGWSGS